jgi:U32 family peptidase
VFRQPGTPARWVIVKAVVVKKRQKPEVMSPAGHWPSLQAAIEAGADSVYFGLKSFSARAKVGFETADLPEVFRTLHSRGVKGFVTFNTLVFDSELRAAARAIESIAANGADAIIVQDVGVLALVRHVAPELEIHASTQMSITDARGAQLAVQMGVHRVTLARELSIPEIEAIAAQCDVELECFVHGALCVAYSGQCFSSEAWGGRSANRGQCAQACRLPYDLLVDGKEHPTGDARYLLSPGDLYALELVPELTRIGVSALKIEGRYKEADYVAATTRAYREAVDSAWAGHVAPVPTAQRLRLEQVYSRGLGDFFMSGVNHQKVVRGFETRHRGVMMGSVHRIHSAAGQAHSIEIIPSEAHRVLPLVAGDGLVFSSGQWDAKRWRDNQANEQGGRVYSVHAERNGHLLLSFGNHDVDASQIAVGAIVWRTHSPQLEKELRQFTAATHPVQRQQVNVEVEAAVGQPLRTRWTVDNHSVEAQSADPLVEARNPAAAQEILEKQLGRLGNTPYQLAGLTLKLSGHPLFPASMLNQVRREAVEALQLAQTQLPPAASRSSFPFPTAAITPQRSQNSCVHLLLRTPEQLDAALKLSPAFRPASITLDYLDLYGLKPSIERVQAAGLPIRVASPRVLKPGEEKIADFLHRLNLPVLVRPASLIAHLPDRELTGDFSLNAANAIAARRYIAMGLHRLTPAHDLNAAQLVELVRYLDPAAVEVIAFQHLPVFHTEHCVFCRFLSNGTSFKDCGRPCEEHRLEIRDPQGNSHPVLADIGCRNTVFNAQAQEASQFLRSWQDAGIEHFRLEFAHESAAELSSITQAFFHALHGELPMSALTQKLKSMAPQSTTQGSLFVPLSAVQPAPRN